MPNQPSLDNKKTVAEGYDQQFKDDFQKLLQLSATKLNQKYSWM